MGDCEICGRQFAEKTKKHVTCSPECSARRKRKYLSAMKSERRCMQCGGSFMSKLNSNRAYCGRECAKAARVERKKAEIADLRSELPIWRRPPKILVPKTERYRPTHLRSHDPQLQRAIDRFLSRGGEVTRLSPGSAQLTTTEEDVIDRWSGSWGRLELRGFKIEEGDGI